MVDRNFTAERLKGFSFGEDGKTVNIYLTPPVDGAPDVMLTMPASAVEEFWNHLGNVVQSIQVANGGKVEPPPPQMAVSWKVGGNSLAPGMTAIMFDAELPSQRVILLTDLAALSMADTIEQKVLEGMSEVDKRSTLKEVEKARGGKPKLIIPPAKRN